MIATGSSIASVVAVEVENDLFEAVSLDDDVLDVLDETLRRPATRSCRSTNAANARVPLMRPRTGR